MSVVPTPRPGGHRARPRPAPAAPAAKAGKGKVIAIAAGAVVVIAIAAAILSSRKTDIPEPPVVAAPPPKVVPKAPPPPPPPKPVPPPEPAPPPPPAPKKPVQDPVEARKAHLAEAAKLLREEGKTRVADAFKEVERDLDREKQEAEAFAKRFANFKADVKLTTNQEYKQAAVTGFTADELRLKTGERDAVVLPWNLVAPESIAAVTQHVYRGNSADDLLAHARFLVERRMWKEAQAVLHKLKKVDDSFEAMADAFDEAAAPLLTGKGLFQGAFKTTGAAGLRLSYDFSDEAQGDDFEGPSGGFALEGGKLTLESKKFRTWVFGDRELEFIGELDIEAKVTVEGALVLVLYAQRDSDHYFVEMGPAGTFLKKGVTFAKAKELAKNDKAVLKGEQKVKVTARRRRISVTIADRPALTFEDKDGQNETRGLFQVGVNEGKVVFAPPFAVSGQVNPDYLKKKVGTIEIEARKSINKDLAEIRQLEAKQLANVLLGGGKEGISADQMAIEFISVQDIPAYDIIKQGIAGRGWDKDKHGGKDLKETLEAWLEKHPGFPSLWYLRGMLHLNASELGEARDKFAKAAGLFPDFHEAHYQWAQTWRYAREFEKALEQAQKALELRPDYSNAIVLAAQMRFAIDKKIHAEADRELRAAEKLGADTDEVLQLRRWVRMQTRGPRDLGCIYEWDSANYRIVTDISQERAMWYADQLEIVRGTYLDLFKTWYRGDARSKPRIAIFNTREAFYTYSELCSTNRHENALGFFDPTNNELVLFEDLDLNETLETLYHEAFHHFASAMLKYPPYWWNEGIAEYMSGVRIDPAKKAVKERARTLRGRLGVIQAFLRPEKPNYVSFEKIINYTPSEFYSPWWIGLHYAQAWSMIHFFYEFQGGKYRPLIEKYFDELAGGKTQRQAFDAVFAGKTEAMEKEWIEFTKALKPPLTP